ncbi:hypothetical protein [Parapedobacter tibetensis]|uniref:hypothetical protein n=1 Tax=Parapedobacter tibetensis TaxID=2972951 RepID=UPI00214DCFF4|nr:hypothetical protein [Parapedobacter tibetensis]
MKLTFFGKVIMGFGLCALAGGCSQPSGIDRQEVVRRHNIINTEVDSLASLTIGNGEFAFTADVTGLQTFPDRYAKGVSLGTQSEWGWNRFDDSVGYRFEETLRSYDFNNDGHEATYSVQWKEAGRNQDAANWFRKNPHRLQLGNVGFDIYKKDGQLIAPTDVQDIRQELDLWTGELTSSFSIEGQLVEVVTTAHQQEDLIAVKVTSALLDEGRLKIRLRYPYPTAEFLDEGNHWADHEHHKTDISQQNKRGAVVTHTLQGITYHTVLGWSGAHIQPTGTPHYFQVTPAEGQKTFECSVLFALEKSDPAELPDFEASSESCKSGWKAFWSRGAAIDFKGSTDARADELERRIVLSQYLTKVQCTGNFPPQETGLTFNSWFGKPHLEMHWWHAVHFALWDRVDLMEKSLGYFAQVADKGRALATRQGYEGIRWQKMVDHEGDESPSSVAAFLIWQQPHFIYLAELAYRDKKDPETIEKYKELVYATAEFMADFPTYDKENDRYNLGKGVIPAQEVFPAVDTYNPTYEVAYWDWALKIAQEWRERDGLPRHERWDEIIDKLAPLPQQDGVYLATESAPDSYTNDRWRTDHPAVLGALGMVPESPKLDKEIMANTLDKVWETWFWEKTWGWDFPMTAMNAARLGLPEKALDALFMDIQTNRYLKNGHNYQDGRLRIYLPGNGGILIAVAMMAGGWDASEGELPGFPKDGSWTVKAEGFKKMP